MGSGEFETVILKTTKTGWVNNQLFVGCVQGNDASCGENQSRVVGPAGAPSGVSC